jgi:hypothetical protein
LWLSAFASCLLTRSAHGQGMAAARPMVCRQISACVLALARIVISSFDPSTCQTTPPSVMKHAFPTDQPAANEFVYRSRLSRSDRGPARQNLQADEDECAGRTIELDRFSSANDTLTSQFRGGQSRLG